ncbi:MAG: heme ABC transporter ATP-binding protein [Opitutales bacterium]|nr:heme ABC transporter ATP-binding protein [Opitutales bacterium]
MISAYNISVSRGGKHILSAVDFKMQPGRLSVVLGPNGAGKSTLLKVLTGVEQPDQGEVRMGERPLDCFDANEMARQRAVLAQETPLTFDFSVEEVVMLGRIPHLSGWESDQDRQAVDRALNFVEMDALRHRRYPTLSGGEKQRVQLARVLAQLDQIGRKHPSDEPAWLFLDEPTSALDLRHQHVVLYLVRRLSREQGIGVCAVLHDLNLAMRYADHVVLLSGGKVAAEGLPADALTAGVIGDVYGVQAEVLNSEIHPYPLIHVLNHQNQPKHVHS